jgi:hypothetical protein
MPGELSFADGYVVWADPFATHDFVHVLDADSGKELYTWGMKGDGPHEFTMATLTSFAYSRLLISDRNKLLQASFPIQSKGDADSVTWSNHASLTHSTRIIPLSDKSYLLFNPAATSAPFSLEKEGNAKAMGKLPLEEKISNGFENYQGEVLYNASKHLLFYAARNIPYVAMYKLDKDSLSLIWEKQEPFEYKIESDELILKEKNSYFFDMTLTKDYIVALKRDVAHEGEPPKNVSGRSIALLPQSLYIYDYQYQLKQIIHINHPTLRIAGNENSNELCACVAMPEYTLIKFSI